MKIRIKDNSVRFRLTRSEVEQFGNTGYYASHTEFNGSKFGYALQAKDGISELQAGFTDNTITLYVPISLAEEWASTDKVGLANSYTLDSGKPLLLLLEKDFVCLDERSEDESDNYPNPKATIHE
ncbi:DUF7009 family protein [Zeaxanthinibacter enoshimensis]|uniref:DUF7009 family protein n=1 Tax=Zeaxanthinibacter enoshimensis TaxID=392009 RepID=UPI00356B38F1